MTDTTNPLLRAIGEPAADTATVDFRERVLLVIAGLFIVVAQTSLILVRGSSIADYWRVGVWAVCALAGHLILQRRLPRRDPFIFPITMLLSGWGLVLIERLAPPFAIRQTAWLVVSTAAMLGITAAPVDLRWLSRYRYLWLVCGLLLLALTIVVGRNPSGGGPRLWLGIPDVYFQPSELLKLLLMAFLASYLADHRLMLEIHPAHIGPLRVPPLRFLAPLLLMWGLSVVVLVWQRDLGTATLFFIIFLAMLYAASGKFIYVLEGFLMLLLASVVAYYAFDVVRLRVNMWINPWPTSDNQSFQIVQSLLAFSAGGVLGQGTGQGSPTYIPVVHSDFVFAAVGEEWGLLGTLVVTTCIALLAFRALKLAVLSDSRPFRSFLAAGIGVTIATQSLLIMGGVLKLIPLTGVTLPFLSYGGSSLLVSFMMVGLLLILSGDSP